MRPMASAMPSSKMCRLTIRFSSRMSAQGEPRQEGEDDHRGCLGRDDAEQLLVRPDHTTP